MMLRQIALILLTMFLTAPAVAAPLCHLPALTTPAIDHSAMHHAGPTHEAPPDPQAPDHSAPTASAHGCLGCAAPTTRLAEPMRDVLPPPLTNRAKILPLSAIRALPSVPPPRG
jgi:hypothetical protein